MGEGADSLPNLNFLPSNHRLGSLLVSPGGESMVEKRLLRIDLAIEEDCCPGDAVLRGGGGKADDEGKDVELVLKSTGARTEASAILEGTTGEIQRREKRETKERKAVGGKGTRNEGRKKGRVEGWEAGREASAWVLSLVSA